MLQYYIFVHPMWNDNSRCIKYSCIQGILECENERYGHLMRRIQNPKQTYTHIHPPHTHTRAQTYTNVHTHSKAHSTVCCYPGVPVHSYLYKHWIKWNGTEEWFSSNSVIHKIKVGLEWRQHDVTGKSQNWVTDIETMHLICCAHTKIRSLNEILYVVK